MVFLRRLLFEVPGVLASSGHVVCGRLHVQSLSGLEFEEVFVDCSTYEFFRRESLTFGHFTVPMVSDGFT